MAAKYPTSVATDADLLVGLNRKQTTLVANLNSSDTSFTLTSDAFAVNVAITIDSEIIVILAKTGAQVTNCVRGFDGTSAASHQSGALVSAYIDAYHHNQIADEIKAIEAALGANLANVPSIPNPLTVNKGGTGVQTLTGIPVGAGASAFSAVAAASEGQIFRRKYHSGSTPAYEFTSPLTLRSRDFDFTAQAPGGSLSIGANTITLSPVPSGVNGTDANHYLYLTGGAGTAEAVLITGGTAVAGAASGTVIVSCANTHSGAWTIGSATAGIYEAIIAGGGAGAAVQLPAGTSTVYAPMEIGSMHGLSIMGCGIGCSTIDIKHATNDLFVVSSALRDLTMSDFSVTSTVTRTAGWVFHISVVYSGNAYLSRSHITRIDVKKQVNGFWFAQFNLSWFTEFMMSDFVGSNGIAVKCGQTVASGVNQGAGMYISNFAIYGNDFVSADPLALGTGLWIEDCDAVEVRFGEIGGTVNGNVRLVANGAGAGVHNQFFDGLISDATKGLQGAGFLVTGTGTVTELFIRGGWYSSAGNLSGGSSAANGIKIDVTTLGRFVIDTYAWLNQGTALYISTGSASGLIKLSGTTNGGGNNANNKDFIYINTTLNSPAPLIAGCYDSGSTGVSLRTSATANLLKLGCNHFASGFSYGISPLSGVLLTATTAAIGGGALVAGNAVTTTTTVTGAVVGMTVETTPQAYPGDKFVWRSYVSAADTVITAVVCLIAGTPAATPFFLRVSN